MVSDIVNVPRRNAAEANYVTDVVPARVISIGHEGIVVKVAHEEKERLVSRRHVQARVTLPWKPSDLSHALIVLRRRSRMTDEYIEDLTVRRNFVIALLRCLSDLGY